MCLCETIGITLLSPRNTVENHWFQWERNNLEDKILAWQRKRKIELREKMQTRRRSPKGRAWNQCENLTPISSDSLEDLTFYIYMYISFHFCLLVSLLLFPSCFLLLFLFKIPSYLSLSVYNIYMILSSWATAQKPDPNPLEDWSFFIGNSLLKIVEKKII